jgi:hypothetical protein
MFCGNLQSRKGDLTLSDNVIELDSLTYRREKAATAVLVKFINSCLRGAFTLRATWGYRSDEHWDCTLTLTDSAGVVKGMDWFGVKDGVEFLEPPVEELLTSLLREAGMSRLEIPGEAGQ